MVKRCTSSLRLTPASETHTMWWMYRSMHSQRGRVESRSDASCRMSSQSSENLLYSSRRSLSMRAVRESGCGVPSGVCANTANRLVMPCSRIEWFRVNAADKGCCPRNDWRQSAVCAAPPIPLAIASTDAVIICAPTSL
ncbi:PP139 [Orf virus]|uniref:PP139 n=1 Tax=Orf virus TaxID=10258 RepID=F1AWU7_ORFV|nr:PP139 [Orf virus]